MLKVDVQRVNVRAKPFFVPVLFFFFNFPQRQNNYPVMQCCLDGGWGGVIWGESSVTLSGASKRSASPCQFCSSGSCSSRSWCVSQEAGGVRL